MTDPTLKTIRPARYLAFFALPILLSIAAITALLLFYRSRGELAAVPFTGNVSFNAKMEFLRKQRPGPGGVLAVGSSMTLNNLDSAALCAHLPQGTQYVNAGAWGLKVSQTREFTRVLVDEYRPRVILLVCGSMDFSRNDQVPMTVARDDLLAFVRGQPYPLAIASHLDLSYYWKQAHLATSRTGYASLAFDVGGGVPLDVHFPAVDSDRWNHTPAQVPPNPAEYDNLHNLAADLNHQGIALVVIQPPLRAAAVATKDAAAALQAHFARVEAALSPTATPFVNMQGEMALPDEQFADYSHLNAEGARVFTDALMQKIAPDIQRLLDPPAAAAQN